MADAPVEVLVGGKAYRVVASADADVLHRLARTVDAKLRDLIAPGKPIPAQALVLAALALAHEVEEERAKRVKIERRAREALRGVLARIDKAVDAANSSAAHVVHDASASGYLGAAEPPRGDR